MEAQGHIVVVVCVLILCGVDAARTSYGRGLQPPSGGGFSPNALMFNPSSPPMSNLAAESRTVRVPLVVPRQPEEALCSVQFAEAKAAQGAADGGGSFLEVHAGDGDGDGGGGGGGGGDPSSVLKSVCHYAGANNVETFPGGAKAQLRFPGRIPFKRVATHFFSCVDPRAKYAILGTPGGDIAEFITALSVTERLRRRQYTLMDVNSVMQRFLRVMNTRGRKYFYMHTDEHAAKALALAAKVNDTTTPTTAVQRNLLIAQSIIPEHVGCKHLKGMLTDSAGYGVRKQLVEWSIQSYLNIYYDIHNPLRNKLLYVITKGPAETKGSGNARIWSPDSCPGIAPALVPDTGTAKTVIHHTAHVKFFRQDLARYFAFLNAVLEVNTLYNEIEKVATQQLAKLSVYTDAAPVDVVFKSMDDRWPF